MFKLQQVFIMSFVTERWVDFLTKKYYMLAKYYLSRNKVYIANKVSKLWIYMEALSINHL